MHDRAAGGGVVWKIACHVTQRKCDGVYAMRLIWSKECWECSNRIHMYLVNFSLECVFQEMIQRGYY